MRVPARLDRTAGDVPWGPVAETDMLPVGMKDGFQSWWREGVLYQIYPRSFADSNQDGVGDLGGIVSRLEHLSWLGVAGIWLTPIMASPDHDFGYDVADYMSVHPLLGDMEAARELIRRAAEAGIRVLLDLVPNHTSDQHPWFLDARSGRSARHRGWYVWADPGPGGAPPNNWLSVFGGPAWTLDERTGQYYLHSFLPSQPDLNWWSEEVRAAFDEILRFWFDRGVAGFRIDTANRLVKDRQLRDDPPAGPGDHPLVRRRGLRAVYSAGRPEVHDVFRRWRVICDQYAPPRILVGETWVFDLAHWASFYGQGDELHLNFNFPFVHAAFGAAELRSCVEAVEGLLPESAWPVWTGSNHDVSRFPTRWCRDDQRKSRAALLMLLALRGSPFIYYGDEIGMTDVPIAPHEHRDPLFLRFPGQQASRDPARTPMIWSHQPGAGFTAPGIKPWLPVGDQSRNLAAQLNDPGSTLRLCRDLIDVRSRFPELRLGAYRSLASPDRVWAWRRGERGTVAVNLSDEAALVPGVRGQVLVSTIRERDGESISAGLALEPWEAAIVEAEAVP